MILEILNNCLLMASQWFMPNINNNVIIALDYLWLP